MKTILFGIHEKAKLGMAMTVVLDGPERTIMWYAGEELLKVDEIGQEFYEDDGIESVAFLAMRPGLGE